MISTTDLWHWRETPRLGVGSAVESEICQRLCFMRRWKAGWKARQRHFHSALRFDGPGSYLPAGRLVYYTCHDMESWYGILGNTTEASRVLSHPPLPYSVIGHRRGDLDALIGRRLFEVTSLESLSNRCLSQWGNHMIWSSWTFW